MSPAETTQAPRCAVLASLRARPGRLLLPLLLAAASVATLVWHARAVQFYCDDSYISYRYAQNFANGHGLVYNLGERVEGYTNFLWVVLLGAGMKLGAQVEPLSLWLGATFLVVALAATASEGLRLFRNRGFALVPVALLVAQGPIVLWSVSGLESSCFTAFTMLAIVAYGRGLHCAKRLLGAGAIYALATMVRPDGVVFAAAAGLHLVACALLTRPIDPRDGLRRAAALTAGFLALFVPFMLWRHAYYDDWLPNTFYVKAGGLVNLRLGLRYLANWSREYPYVAGLAALGALASMLPEWRGQRRTLAHYLLAIALFSAYLVWAGGDYMALYRFIVPLLPLVALLGTAGLETVLLRIGERLRVPQPLLALVGVALLAGVGWACVQPTKRSLHSKKIEQMSTVMVMKENSRKWTLAGKAVKRALPPDITLATTAAGAIPFFGEQRTIDESGLCDRYTAKIESDPWLLDRVGHMKQATRAYLGQRRPEVILWHPHVEPPPEPGKEPVMLPPTPDYELRALAVPGLEEEGLLLYLWVRKDLVKSWEARGVRAPTELQRSGHAKSKGRSK